MTIEVTDEMINVITNEMTNMSNKLGELENPPPSDFPAAQVR